MTSLLAAYAEVGSLCTGGNSQCVWLWPSRACCVQLCLLCCAGLCSACLQVWSILLAQAELLGVLESEGQEMVVAQGGRGGRGNAVAPSNHQRPASKVCSDGHVGQEVRGCLRLRHLVSLAHTMRMALLRRYCTIQHGSSCSAAATSLVCMSCTLSVCAV